MKTTFLTVSIVALCLVILTGCSELTHNTMPVIQQPCPTTSMSPNAAFMQATPAPENINDATPMLGARPLRRIGDMIPFSN